MAQKYGWYDGAVNTVGIVQTETPYLIAVFTDNLYDAENIIGKTNLIFYDYTVHLMEHQKLALAGSRDRGRCQSGSAGTAGCRNSLFSRGVRYSGCGTIGRGAQPVCRAGF